MLKQILGRVFSPLLIISILGPTAIGPAPVQAQEPPPGAIIHKIQKANERMEMMVNTSRIVTLGQKIPRLQVDNPDVLELTALSPTEVLVFAKSAGVTQVNLWGEDKQVYTIDVIVYGDAQELTTLLRTQFPNASLNVVPVASGVLISGFVDQPEDARLIVRIAEQYYPEVINAMEVSNVQQVLLHVKVMEVSRTKLRALGFDWAQISGANVVESGLGAFLGTAGATFAFDVIDGNDELIGLVDALRKDSLMKILAEPNIVAVSGRPSYFEVGGELGYVSGVDRDTGARVVAWKEYGTRVDFVAIVLGNGRIRLEVRPRVSEPDAANSIGGIPALKTRTVDTGVELQAGQTLAIAGLVQNRIEVENRGLPWISEVPYLGALFRRVEEKNNEVELLILVTPELVDAMDAQEVPQCLPGMRTTSPSDWELYLQGHLEVPNCCPSDCGQPIPGGMILEQRESSSPAGQPTAGKPATSHSRYSSSKPQISPADSRPGRQTVEPGLIGPIGYDVVK